MSNRDSLGFGDLIPQDVVDIFAQEKHNRRSQKKRSHSLGRALGWLKGKKRRDLNAKGESLGLGPALDLALNLHPAGHRGGQKGGQRSGRQAAHPHGNSHVVRRRDNDKTPPPPSLQENVFIEASRPKYLENLHSEALEGLKMMQQDEANIGVEYKDNESTISTMTVQTDGEGGGFITDSTIADTTSVTSVQSSVSTRSSRSGLTRKDSTFRPLSSGKKSEKGRTRKRNRKTDGGIPHHVQMELGLDRGGWTVTPRLNEEQLYNGETDESSTTDGPQQAAESQKGAVASPQEMNTIQLPSKDMVEQLSATHAGHRDDMALLHCLVPHSSDEQRPRSLAVPWMTTANSLQQKPPSAVMSMSPQAAYLSKIIPNAVLPPSVDVVEISRGQSRNSVRTVGLVLSSPGASRSSSRASSSRASTINSASRYNPPNLSDSSWWSTSDSSDTLVSDSTTVSCSSTPRQNRSQDGDRTLKADKNSIHSSISKDSKCTNGKVIVKGDGVKKEGPFLRSMSVKKPKRAPPPPNRSYSLYNKMKRRSRDLAEVTVISGKSSLHSIAVDENKKNKCDTSSTIDSPGYNADTSSLEDSTGSVSLSPLRSQLQALKAGEAPKVEATAVAQDKQESLLSKIVSPSSGYSSQEATSKQAHSSSPRHKKGIFAKLQRFFPGSSPAASVIPPLTLSEVPENTKSSDIKLDTSVDTVNVSPSVRALIELFNIPPPPKVRAPPPPPPEVWANSKRTFELLLGPPAPDNIYAIIKKNPKDRRQQRKSPSASMDGSENSLGVERKQKIPITTVESVNGSLGVLETKRVQESAILNAEIHEESNDRLAEQNVELKRNRKVTEINEKVRVSDILNGMLVKAVERQGERMTGKEAKKASTQARETNTKMGTSPDVSLVRIPPSPSPPVHSLPRPPNKQATEFAAGTSEQVVTSPEMSWPPPPPPIGLGGPDEFDFPLPPPPVFGEEDLVIPVQVLPKKSNPGGDSSCTSTSISSGVKTECVRVIAEAEPQKVSTSQRIVPPHLNIPPPPSYTAPPPPDKAVSRPVTKNVSRISKKVSPLPPCKEVSPPPPSKDISPPLPKEVSSPTTPKEVPPPPPEEVSPLPSSKEVSPPPAIAVSPPLPHKEVSPPPQPKVLPPPKEVCPLPAPESVPTPKVVSLQSQCKEISPPAPNQASPPSPPKEKSPVKPEEMSPSPIQVPSPLVEDVPSTLVTVISPSQVKEASPPIGIQVSPLPPKQVSTQSNEDVSLLSFLTTHQPSEEPTNVEELVPLQSIPPPAPLQAQSSVQEINLPQENNGSEFETNPDSSKSIFAPPQSIPPLPPIEALHQTQVAALINDGPATQEASLAPPSEVSIQPALESAKEKTPEPVPTPPVDIPLPPPLPVQGLASKKHESSPDRKEEQTPELSSAPVQHDDSNPIVTPSLLQMVKLRSVNSSPEVPKAQEQPENEVIMRNQHSSNQVSTSSSGSEAPQKPIRKSLIITSPTSTSPPAIVTSQPALPKIQPVVVPPVSLSLSPTKKSPPAMSASPSMNLQEAIRLRTAARSLGVPAFHLSSHSPTSPTDLCKSPTSTASFIFSKSNKKVVTETKQVVGTKATVQKNQEVFPLTKVVSEEELVQKGVKVPPPVAKKPQTKGKEIETSEEIEQTAGQEEKQEGITDVSVKKNGTA